PGRGPRLGQPLQGLDVRPQPPAALDEIARVGVRLDEPLPFYRPSLDHGQTPDRPAWENIIPVSRTALGSYSCPCHAPDAVARYRRQRRSPVDMAEPSREQLRAVFDQAAELYDRARPGYPAELVEELVQFAEIQAGSRVLEIGCGTGQLTAPLAERGCEIIALDLGPNLAAVAPRNLAAYPSAPVIG